MPQAKTSQTMLNIEALFDDKIEFIVRTEGFTSKSSYLRNLVIRDLLERKLIDQNDLLQVMS